MSRDEIQKLIGGYATGSLTEAERKLLFDAALEDQELFDQLAQEQALKEILDEPGVKQRLVAALDPERPRAIVWWPWATAALTASLAILIGVVMLRTPEKPRQIAAVPRVEAPAPVAQPEPPAPELPLQPKAQPEKVAKNAPAPRAFAPPPPPPAEVAPPAKPIELPNDAKALEPVAAPPAVAAPKPEILGFRAADQTAGQQAGQAGQAFAGGGPAVIGGVQVPGGRGGRGGGGGGGGKGGGGGGVAPQNAAARAVATRFAFDYSFDNAGALRIVPTSAGSLMVTAPAQPTPSVLLPARSVVPGTPVVVPIPADASEVTVSFTGSAAVTAPSAPVRRDEAAGTVEDQSPPNQRILVTIPVNR